MTKLKTMICLNPYEDKKFSRVVVFAKSDDGKVVRVLNVGAINLNPDILKPFGSAYSAAPKLWNFVSTVVFLIGVALSFFWKWWAFVPAIILAYVIYRANRDANAENALEIINNNPTAFQYFLERRLIWEMPIDSLIPE